MDILKRISRLVTEFWEMFLAVAIAVAAIGVSLIDVAGINQDQVLTGAILLSLATLTTSMLRDRNRLITMEQHLQAIIRDRSRLCAEDFFVLAGLDPYGDLRQSIGQAREIWILGMSNLKTITNYETELKQVLRNGGKLRVIMLNPVADNPAMIMQAARRSLSSGTNTSLSHGIEALELLNRMKSVSKQPTKVGVGGLQYLPSFGCLAINPLQKNGIMCVKLYPFRRSKSEYPTFKLTPDRDGAWYRFYTSQFELLWEASIAIDPP